MNFVLNCLILLATVNYVHGFSLCPASCVCDDSRLLVKCFEGKKNLDYVPITLIPSVERLYIRYNAIKVIDYSINFYAELRILDLSDNEIFNVQDNVFIYQGKLRQMNLNNNKISIINKNTFKGLSRMIELNLRANFIMEITEEVFPLTIEILNLGQNRISSITPNAFKYNVNLKSLYLDDNILTALPTNAFTHMKLLAELFIGQNMLYQIKNDAFENLNNLVHLSIHGSRINNISSAAFYHLKNLKSLDISDNMLKRIPTGQLRLLSRLESLKIGNNDFEIMEEGAFYGLSYLQNVDISSCRNLNQIQPGAFAANPNLETIILSSNKILSEIQDGVFSNLPNIKNVDLKNNGLKTVREEILPWKSLQSFDISENLLICDCRLSWLNVLLEKKQSTNEIFCSFPLQFKGERIENIFENRIGCQNSSNRQTLYGLLFIIIFVFGIILFKHRSLIVQKYYRTSEQNSNITDQNHIYEEISNLKHNESIENAINSNIYSFGCPFLIPDQYSSSLYCPSLPTGTRAENEYSSFYATHPIHDTINIF